MTTRRNLLQFVRSRKALAVAAALAALVPLSFPSPATAQTTCNAPTLTDRTVIATTTVNVGTSQLYSGYFTGILGSLSGDSSFTINSDSYTITRLFTINNDNVGESSVIFIFGISSELSGGDRARVQVHVCDETLRLIDAALVGETGVDEVRYQFDGTGLDWSSESSRTVRLSIPTADSEDATLVSNFAQASDTSNDTGNPRAMRFSTGPNLGGYRLSSISTISEDDENDSFSATLCPTGAGGFPQVAPSAVPSHRSCVALTAPDSFEAGVIRFTAPLNTYLAPSTTYTVVFLKGSGVDRVKYDATYSASEDAGSATGWTIGNGYEFYHASGEWRTTTSTRVYHISIGGSAVSKSVSGVNPIVWTVEGCRHRH